MEGLAKGTAILEHEAAQVLLLLGFVFSILRYFPGSIGEYTIHMIATDSDMELSSPLELEWREEDFCCQPPR